MPPRCGRAPAPPEAIHNVEYCLIDRVLPGEMDGKLSSLLRFYFPRERNGRQGEGWEGRDNRSKARYSKKERGSGE